MSLLVPNNNLHPMEEVLPAALAVKNLSRASVLTQRRRVRVAPQTGVNYGPSPPTSSNNAAQQQIQFLVSDQGGLLDPSSVCVVYNIQTTGTGNEVPDDGHPFVRAQITLNGQVLDDIQQAAKCTNAEVKLGASQSWYKTSGSFCGFELLNGELAVGAPVGSVANVAGNTNQMTAYNPAWGDVSNNTMHITNRTSNSAGTVTPTGSTQTGSTGVGVCNILGGEQRVLPLGLLSGVGRMRNYLPLGVLGQLSLTLLTGSSAEVCFQNSGSVDAYYSLRGVFMEYDVVIPATPYSEILTKMATDPGEGGLILPYESTIMASSGTIGGNATPVESETSVIVSRATNNLVRSFFIMQPQSLLQSYNYPCQSCFSFGQTQKVQWRIASQFFPSIPAEGEASMWAMSQEAYGAAGNSENGSCINRELWHQSTEVAAAATTPTRAYGNQKFNHADSFIPAYNFRNVKGLAEEVDLDGVSLSQSSGAQLVFAITCAPKVTMTPTLGVVATRMISARAGAITIVGA